MEHHHTFKTFFDFAAIGVTAAAVLKALPAIAAVLSIVWTAIRIYETRTIQRLLGKTPE